VTGLSGVDSVSAGSYHAVAVKGDGTALAWGWNFYGQLGDGTTVDSPVPVVVPGVHRGIVGAAGGHHSAALEAGHRVKAWGRNDRGQLGDGTTAASPDPVAVTGFP
jgi:alpha-tubulin suppressor-like RCC1 family protein